MKIIMHRVSESVIDIDFQQFYPLIVEFIDYGEGGIFFGDFWGILETVSIKKKRKEWEKIR